MTVGSKVTRTALQPLRGSGTRPRVVWLDYTQSINSSNREACLNLRRGYRVGSSLGTECGTEYQTYGASRTVGFASLAPD